MIIKRKRPIMTTLKVNSSESHQRIGEIVYRSGVNEAQIRQDADFLL